MIDSENFDLQFLLQHPQNQLYSATMEDGCSQSPSEIIFGLFILITVSGTLGNAACFVVVLLKGKKTGTNFLLAVLVFTDMVYLLLYLAKNTLSMKLTKNIVAGPEDMYNSSMVNQSNETEHLYNSSVKNKSDDEIKNMYDSSIFLRFVLDEIHRIVQLISVWLVVLLAGLRSIAIRDPYFAMQYCTKKNLVIACLITTFICIAIHMPFAIIWINMSCALFLKSPCFFDFDVTNMRIHDFVFYYQHLCYNMCLLFLIPGIFVCVFSVFLIRDLRKRHNRLVSIRQSTRISSQQNHRNRRDNSDVTILVLATVLIFLITYSSQFIFGLFMVLIDLNLSPLSPCFEEWMFHTTYIVSSLNASVHFATNFTFRQHFRHSCKLLCGCWIARSGGRNEQQTRSSLLTSRATSRNGNPR